MAKYYYIENNKGQWMSVPGEGTCWSWDPHKAWKFEEKREPIKWMTPARSLGKTMSYSWGIIDFGAPGSMVTRWLEQEGCGEYKIVEYDFQFIDNGGMAKPDMFRDKITHDLYIVNRGRVSAYGTHMMSAETIIIRQPK